MIYKLNGIPFDIWKMQFVAGANYAPGDLLKNKDRWAGWGITEEADPPPIPLTQAELDQATANSISALWQAAHEYEQRFVSGVGIGLLTVGFSKGLPKAIAFTQWTQTLWDEYYKRKALVTSTFDPLLQDFSSVGTPPHTIPELRTEAGL